MSKVCKSSKKNIYQEAINHCRWKKILNNMVLSNVDLQSENLHKFSGLTFDDILLHVHKICKDIRGIGMLAIYDITSAICRYNKININKIYIVGKGPKRAINLLELKTKTRKIKNVSVKYVEIPNILKAFKDKDIKIDPKIQNSNNGDDFESYICNWQKNK